LPAGGNIYRGIGVFWQSAFLTPVMMSLHSPCASASSKTFGTEAGTKSEHDDPGRNAFLVAALAIILIACLKPMKIISTQIRLGQQNDVRRY